MSNKTFNYLGVGLLVAGLSLSGCSTMDNDTADGSEMNSYSQSAESTQAKQAANTGGGFFSAAAPAGSELLPNNAKPGQCYARAFIPPTYKTENVQVLKSEASDRFEVIPAKYEWVQEKVLVKEASERIAEVIPATYENVQERILVSPASSRIEVSPPVYKTVTEKVLDKPEHTVWKKGSGPITKVNEATGEIMCLVTVPATYKTVSKRVLAQPAATREVEIPAVYKTISKRVMKTPPTPRKVIIPAEYSIVKVKKLVEPAKTTKVAIPEKYDTVTKRIMASEGRVEWQPVLCKTNMTPDVGLKLQQALKESGYNPGQIDGVIGTQTLSAVESYQRKKGLPRGGLTLQTLDSLGVALSQ